MKPILLSLSIILLLAYKLCAKIVRNLSFLLCQIADNTVKACKTCLLSLHFRCRLQETNLDKNRIIFLTPTKWCLEEFLNLANLGYMQPLWPLGKRFSIVLVVILTLPYKRRLYYVINFFKFLARYLNVWGSHIWRMGITSRFVLIHWRNFLPKCWAEVLLPNVKLEILFLLLRVALISSISEESSYNCLKISDSLMT